MAKEKHYIEMTASDCRLAYHALMQFRNDVIAKGIDPLTLTSLFFDC